MSSHALLEHFNLSFALNGCIVEIGSARESVDVESSTHYFRELSRRLNSEFFSVDFSEQSNALARALIGSNAILSDGKVFLENFRTFSKLEISILYLDNFDIIYNEKHEKSLRSRVGTAYAEHGEELSNQRSAEVHLEQARASISLLGKQNIIICDDTKLQDGLWWGKGALVVPFLLARDYKIKEQSEDGVLLVSPGFILETIANNRMP